MLSAVDVIREAIKLSEVKLHGSMAISDDVVSSYGVVTTGKYSLTSAAKDALTIASGSKGFSANLAYEISKHRCWARETDGLVAQVAF